MKIPLQWASRSWTKRRLFSLSISGMILAVRESLLPLEGGVRALASGRSVRGNARVTAAFPRAMRGRRDWNPDGLMLKESSVGSAEGVCTDMAFSGCVR